MTIRTLLALTSALTAPGCGFLYHLGGGGVAGLDDRDGRFGVEAQGHAGYGWGSAEVAYGFGGSARVRVTEGVQQLAGGSHFFVTALSDGPSPYLRVGAHLLQLERVDEGFGFGMMSPFAEVGVSVLDAVAASHGFFGTGFWLGLWVGHDTRLTDQPSETFVGLTLGWAMAGGAR